MKELLAKINEKIDALDDQDVEGHIWWNKFKELVEGYAITEHQLQYASGIND